MQNVYEKVKICGCVLLYGWLLLLLESMKGPQDNSGVSPYQLEEERPAMPSAG